MNNETEAKIPETIPPIGETIAAFLGRIDSLLDLTESEDGFTFTLDNLKVEAFLYSGSYEGLKAEADESMKMPQYIPTIRWLSYLDKLREHLFISVSMDIMQSAENKVDESFVLLSKVSEKEDMFMLVQVLKNKKGVPLFVRYRLDQ